jgi:hypothetical protein
MKSIKHIALTVVLTVSAFCAVLYTSCSKDACKGVTCQNGGTCSGGNCTCTTGYEGTNCETLSRDKFVGTYTGSEICSIGTDNYTIALTASSNNLQLTYTNLYNQGFTATCNMAATDSFTFAGSDAVSGATYSGSGRLVTNTITVHYSIVNGTTSNSCIFTGTK